MYSSISCKEREINEMEYLVLQRIPSEFANFEFLFKKELEIHNKMKMENNLPDKGVGKKSYRKREHKAKVVG